MFSEILKKKKKGTADGHLPALWHYTDQSQASTEKHGRNHVRMAFQDHGNHSEFGTVRHYAQYLIQTKRSKCL